MSTGIGNLPYAMPAVSPFDTITAQETNERIANIESLADGTGVGDGAVTGDKIDFSTMQSSTSSKTLTNTSNFATSSTTMSTKMSTTLNAGRYLATYSVPFANGGSGASGETNSRLLMDGGQYAPMVGFLPNMTYTNSLNVGNTILDVPADGTTVALQTSVNWPARGTFSTAAFNAQMTFVRIG